MGDLKQKYNPISGQFDLINAASARKSFQGEINIASDFPDPLLVEDGDWYTIGTAVTDNDPTKTNTGQSFTVNQEIAWDGASWIELGSNVWADTGTTVVPIQNGRSVDLTSSGQISFNTAYAGTLAEGELAWDNVAGTLMVGMPGGSVKGQLLQEMYLPNRPKNIEGVDIDNGQLVYGNSATGSVPEVKLANAASFNTSLGTIAMATEDNVNDLLNNFWELYLKYDKRGEALSVLDLTDPVTDKEIVLPTLNLGLSDEFLNHGSHQELLTQSGLDSDGIYNAAAKRMQWLERSNTQILAK